METASVRRRAVLEPSTADGGVVFAAEWGWGCRARLRGAGIGGGGGGTVSGDHGGDGSVVEGGLQWGTHPIDHEHAVLALSPEGKMVGQADPGDATADDERIHPLWQHRSRHQHPTPTHRRSNINSGICRPRPNNNSQTQHYPQHHPTPRQVVKQSCPAAVRSVGSTDPFDYPSRTAILPRWFSLVLSSSLLPSPAWR